MNLNKTAIFCFKRFFIFTLFIPSILNANPVNDGHLIADIHYYSLLFTRLKLPRLTIGQNTDEPDMTVTIEGQGNSPSLKFKCAKMWVGDKPDLTGVKEKDFPTGEKSFNIEKVMDGYSPKIYAMETSGKTIVSVKFEYRKTQKLLIDYRFFNVHISNIVTNWKNTDKEKITFIFEKIGK